MVTLSIQSKVHTKWQTVLILILLLFKSHTVIMANLSKCFGLTYLPQVLGHLIFLPYLS